MFHANRYHVKPVSIALLAFALLFPAMEALAHPGSGIVVDRQGNVYFLDTGSGVWKIDKEGKLTKLAAPAYHWMAIDLDQSLATATLPSFSQGDATVTRDSGDPRIIVSSDFPITVGRDGALYYGWTRGSGQLQVFRFAPSGATTVVKTLTSSATGKPLGWLNGVVATSDGSIYYTEDNAIRRIGPQGELTTVIANVTISTCDSLPDAGGPGPYLRGFDVDPQGTLYVAATGCRAVLKITADKQVTTVLQASSPWSPTAVAVSGSDLYVLEYLHTPGDDRREWLPRVRKVSSNGSVVTIATIDR